MKNEDLKAKYDDIYRHGAESFFTKFSGGRDISEANALVLSAVDWSRRTVLDAGCGEGHLAAQIAALGAASVTGIDYAMTAVEKARAAYVQPNLSFRCMSLDEWREPVDYIVSMGTLEHMDDPSASMMMLARNLKPHGKLILTCPCFINLRGFVWMTLQLLQNVPMSLTDLHFLSPFDMERMAMAAGLTLERIDSCDHSRGNGELMLQDLRKRLTNALRDAQIDNSRVEVLLTWLESVSALPGFDTRGPLMGATGFYVLGSAGTAE